MLGLLAARDIPTLRSIAVGGERCLAELANRWCRDRFLLNIYGPTETTIYCLSAPLQSAVLKDPPIGRQVQNMQAYLLDRHLYLVPTGVPGEIFVSGVGLARGYLNRPATTAEKFLPNPFGGTPGQRLYMTGDMGRYLPDGQVEFLGRLDNQVKVKGYRMELEEIEAVLRQCPGVASAVVLAREDSSGDQELVAYVVNDASKQASVKNILQFLHERMPNYMVPSSYVLLESMPVTTHGKIDRKALPPPKRIDAETEENFVPPRTPVEELLAGIWAELLNLERVSIHDNFFDLGGRSLNATQLMSRIRNTLQIELPLDSLFNTPTVAGLASLVEKTRSISQAPQVRRVPRDGPLPLSFAQQRLWFLHQITPTDAHDLYNGPLNFRLQGTLDVSILERILREIIARHEPLRTGFKSVNGQPVQVIEDRVEFSLPITDLRQFPQDEREAEARRIAALDAKRPFDLSKAPLLRAELLRLDEQDHILVMTIHHIVFDIWSMGVFAREILALYEAFSENRPSPMPDLRIAYADFAQWQREWLQGEVLEQQLNYWKAQLKDLPELHLPTDYPRPERPTFKGDLVLFQLPVDLSDEVRRLSRQESATLFMVLLAAFNTLLYRYSGQEDVVTSTAIANRNWSEIEPLIGFFVNTLVLRASIAGGPTFRELLGRVRKVTLDAYAHQDLPFEKLVEELRPERDTSHAPMFRTMIGLLNIPVDTNINIPGLKITQFKTHNRAAKFDIILRMTDRDDGLRGEIEYDTDLFSRKTVEGFVTHFRNILEAVTANPDIGLIDIPLEKSGKEIAIGAPSNLSSRYTIEQFDF
jgi:acyl carrier protein